MGSREHANPLFFLRLFLTVVKRMLFIILSLIAQKLVHRLQEEEVDPFPLVLAAEEDTTDDG